MTRNTTVRAHRRTTRKGKPVNVRAHQRTVSKRGEVGCRYCGHPSEDRSGVCYSCERKYEK